MFNASFDGHMRLFNSLVGYEYDFYGVDNCVFCIGIDGKRMAFEAIEDPSDGYRSYFDSFQISLEGHIFFDTALARIRLDDAHGSDDEFDGWKLVDIFDGHVWLEVGTDHSDSYYPSFTFRYSPKES